MTRLAVFMLLLLFGFQTAPYAQTRNDVVDPAVSFYTGFGRSNTSRRFWDILDRQPRAHLFGWIGFGPAIGAIQGLTEPQDGDSDLLMADEYRGRLHKIPIGPARLSIYGEYYSASDASYDYDSGEWSRNISEEYWKFRGAISVRDAIELGGRRLSASSTGPTRLSEIDDLWGIEFHLLRMSNLFPNLENAVVNVGGSQLTVVDWDTVSIRNLLTVGNDSGNYSGVIYTGAPIVHSLIYDRFTGSDLNFLSPRIASSNAILPLSFTPTYELTYDRLTEYEVTLDYMRLIFGIIWAFQGDWQRAFQPHDFYVRMEKGLPIHASQPDYYAVTSPVISYTRQYYDPYSSLEQRADVETWAAEFKFGASVAGYGVMFIGIKGAFATDLETGEQNVVGEFSFGTGLGNKLLGDTD